MILLYKRTRAIWGIIIAHSWFDITGSLLIQLDMADQIGPATAMFLAKLAPIAFGAAYVVISLIRYKKASATA